MGLMLKKYSGLCDCIAEAASIESVILRKLVDVARVPLWRGGRLEAICSIGYRPGLGSQPPQTSLAAIICLSVFRIVYGCKYL